MPQRPASLRGTLVSWNDARGFGFIETEGGRARVFVHASAFASAGPRPHAGDRVGFELGAGPDGRQRARQASVLASHADSGIRMPTRAPRPHARPSALPFVPVAVFAVFLALAIAAWGASAWFASIYIGMSAIAFGVYAWDKQAAIDGAWRTRESTLQALALLGGWPGAVFAQQLLRHKSRKTSFQLVFWLLVIVNVAAFVALVWRPELVAQLSDELAR
ncbi:cold shock and DUF1294 domain-containing protein [Gryllotalpicola koreensis]|uniref:DUF1294 domain-containing protein n=1 Tax=Gryllotalpicola koreensis TaxID=993086 RepID=A0ABP7ZV34_9MICO